MAYLYLDTSHNYTFGLLDSDFSWIVYERVETKRTSDIAHKLINEALDVHNLKASELEGVITLAGPGSYTGMRVAEGIAQILELEGIKIYSFTALQVPRILEISDYAWISPAFKKETFVQTESERMLISDDELESFKSKNSHLNFVTHFNGLYEGVRVLEEDLRNAPEKIFGHVVKNGLREKPFYYRSLEAEFKKASK